MDERGGERLGLSGDRPFLSDADETERAGGAVRGALERKGRRTAGAVAELDALLAGTIADLKGALSAFRGRGPVALHGEDGDEAGRKAAQAEAKASIDAIALIVRTLEKIDSLQRTLADDRAAAAETALDDAGYHALVHQIEALIDARIRAEGGRCAACPSGDGHAGGAAEGQGDRTQGGEGAVGHAGWPGDDCGADARDPGGD